MNFLCTMSLCVKEHKCNQHNFYSESTPVRCNDSHRAAGTAGLKSCSLP